MSPVGAALLYARARVRRDARAWGALALVVMLAGGAVLAAFAGARRTDSAFRRFARRHLAADVVVFPLGSTLTGPDFATLAREPEVVASADVTGFMTDGPGPLLLSGAFGTTIDTPEVVSGRLPAAADEASVSEVFAHDNHLHVGGDVPVRFVGSGGVLTIRLRVVGVHMTPLDFPPQLRGGFFVDLLVGPAFAAAHAASLAPPFHGLLLRLRRGDADGPLFESQLRSLEGSRSGTPAEIAYRLAQQEADVNRGIHLQAVAIWILGGFLAGAAVLVLFQLVSRQTLLDTGEHGVLRALGMTREALWVSGVCSSALVGAAAAVGAVVVAVAASLLLPVGTARLADAHPGIAVDPLVCVLGAAAIALLVPASAAWPSWRSASISAAEPDAGQTQPPAYTRLVASLPPTATVGVGMALTAGRGRTAVPVRSSLAGVCIALAAMAAAVSFGASLTHMIDTPRLYGWNWDVHLSDNQNQPVSFAPLVHRLAADRRIDAAAFVDTPPLTVGSADTTGVAIEDVKGVIAPVVVSGREPQSPSEVALGARTLQALHAHLGETVPVAISLVTGGRQSKRVVGTVVVPPEGNTARLGLGAVITYDGELTMAPPGIRPPSLSEAVLRFAPGVDRARLLGDIRREAGADVTVDTATAPADFVNFGHVQNLPLILAGLLAALAVATLGHTLVSSVTRRGRDLAVLKTLGFRPRQVRRAVAWQSTTVAVLALVIGLPIGVAAGRLLWDAFASQLGTVPVAVVPAVPILLIAPAAVLLANAVAGGPAVLASRARAAVVLRSE